VELAREVAPFGRNPPRHAFASTHAACDNDADDGFDSALDSSAKLNALSTGGLQALCDWTNAQEGGYGAVIPCDAGASSIEADSNQAACVAESMQHFDKVSCPGTVGDWMMCVEWRLSNWCSANPPAPTGQCEALQNGCFGSGYPEDAGTDQ